MEIPGLKSKLTFLTVSFLSGEVQILIYMLSVPGATILHYGDAAVEDKCLLENLYGDNPDKLTSLRNFRDDVLNSTRQGKLTVRAYYTISPLLVTLIEHSSWLRSKLENSIDTVLPSLGVEID